MSEQEKTKILHPIYIRFRVILGFRLDAEDEWKESHTAASYIFVIENLIEIIKPKARELLDAHKRIRELNETIRFIST